jgi:hypothetical protein
MKIKDIKYGLIVVDPEEEGEEKSVLHFCGYENKPTKEDINSLFYELEENESFGLSHIVKRLLIIEADDAFIESIKQQALYNLNDLEVIYHDK